MGRTRRGLGLPSPGRLLTPRRAGTTSTGGEGPYLTCNVGQNMWWFVCIMHNPGGTNRPANFTCCVGGTLWRPLFLMHNPGSTNKPANFACTGGGAMGRTLFAMHSTGSTGEPAFVACCAGHANGQPQFAWHGLVGVRTGGHAVRE